MKRRNGLVLCLLIPLLAACSQREFAPEAMFGLEEQARSGGMAQDLEAAAAESLAHNVPAPEAAGTGSEANPDVSAGRKLVRRADIRIRVSSPESADVAVHALMEKYGAYAASTQSYENSYRYEIRLPHGAYNAFLAGAEGLGKLLHRS